MHDHEQTCARVRELPAAWYAAQPIPARLALALVEPLSLYAIGRSEVKGSLVRQAGEGRPKLSLVEQAHRREANRMARRDR